MFFVRSSLLFLRWQTDLWQGLLLEAYSLLYIYIGLPLMRQSRCLLFRWKAGKGFLPSPCPPDHNYTLEPVASKGHAWVSLAYVRQYSGPCIRSAISFFPCPSPFLPLHACNTGLWKYLGRRRQPVARGTCRRHPLHSFSPPSGVDTLGGSLIMVRVLRPEREQYASSGC